MGFPQSVAASPKGATDGIMVASTNVKYSDSTSYSFTTSGSGKSIPCFLYYPKATGEIQISVEFGVGSTASASTLHVYSAGVSQPSAGSGVGTQGGAALSISALTPPGTQIAFDPTNASSGFGTSGSGILATATLSIVQYTFNYTILKRAPIWIGCYILPTTSFTLRNLRISYDLIR
jgi:hypothetical protein